MTATTTVYCPAPRGHRCSMRTVQPLPFRWTDEAITAHVTGTSHLVNMVQIALRTVKVVRAAGRSIPVGTVLIADATEERDGETWYAVIFDGLPVGLRERQVQRVTAAVCGSCDKPFVDDSGRAIYCSDLCRRADVYTPGVSGHPY